MATEAWFRNPKNYIRELAEVCEGKIAWDRGSLAKSRIDPVTQADLHFPPSVDFRLLCIGEQGTAELRRGYSMERPYAVYPTWTHGDSLDLLEELMAKPVGEDPSVFGDMDLPPDERPVEGQEHRVVATHLPAANSTQGKRLLQILRELQREYPECILHVHGLYSWRISFGFGFGAADVDPRMDASKGRVVLPNGKNVPRENLLKYRDWVKLLDYEIETLSAPRERCMFNIRSAQWAGQYYMENVKFRKSGKKELSPMGPPPRQQEGGSWKSTLQKPVDSDMVHCDSCTLASTCKYYREGMVCSVPGSVPSSFVKKFGTRDPDTIIDGLSKLLEVQAGRVQDAVEEESTFEEINPEVTKMINSLFANGEKLAKLLKPELGGKGTQVGVFVQNGRAVTAGSPNQLLAGVVNELEAQGIPRDQITPEMIKRVLDGDTEEARQRAAGEIEAGRDDDDDAIDI